ncbi:glycosyl hydrolase family 76-domain-containing protein [Schizothecium vesticola]|uniref:mannan endo-1,6-alpha-mannosidase n=1 Tax=Schizothecium vesticola TaxID=314040 RepID=A0AA40F1R7_9PEZI|nr:glycosyl hydrolase family 76-domain-containing protein [Schizothecium vesticola]
MSFYGGHKQGGTPGLLPAPYYWWEAGALMGALVDYWYYTGDTKWNDVAEEGLLFQVGPNNDYMPPNQTRTEGNDDQGFWGMAVMTAAEYRFQDPAPNKPQWLGLAQAVFNTQAARWDPHECGGGLRWQIFTWNNGYDYKNSISQGCFFNIAARLALYTGNQSYAAWADRAWDWMASTKLLDPESYYVYDGMHTTDCSRITPYQWSYNAGAFLLGAAAMYNSSEGHTREIWRERVDGLLNGTMVFFAGPDANIISEVACEPVGLCDLDQQSFKAYLARWMAATIKWAPWTGDRIRPLLEASAEAALMSCVGGDNKRMCGHNWTAGKWDGLTGVGQQMAAMEVLLANMIDSVPAPVTEKKGGTSAGDPGAGGSDMGRTDPFSMSKAQDPETARTVAGRARGPALLPQHFSALFERHGQTYYGKALGRWILLTNEPENIKTVLGTNMYDWPIDGPRLFAALPVLGPRSIFTTNGQEWFAARTMMRPAFVRDQVSDLKCFGKHIDNFLAVIPRDGSTFDIQELILKLTMDSSTDFLLGHSTNSLVYASPEALQFYRDFEYASSEAAVRSLLGPILHYLPHPKLKKSAQRLRQYIRFYLRKVTDKGPSETKDRSYVFIDELLKLKPTEDYLIDQILSVIVAGRDTTASGLSAIFYCLARHPDAVKRLKGEMAQLGAENPTWEQLKQMKYLNNVIKEAMRLFPPISTNSRTSNKETILPVGGGTDGSEPLLVAKGTSLRWSTYGTLHRRKDMYGADADEFRPERWESNLRVGWEYIPFSGGPRICIGQQFALTQMSYTLFRFFKMVNGIEARDTGEPLLQSNLTLSFAKGCMVAVKPE